MSKRRLSLGSSSGFTIMEIMIAAAILLVISLGISQIMVGSQRSLNKSDIYLVRQTLEKYMSSMVMTEKARCNSIKAKGALWTCSLECKECLEGTALCGDGTNPFDGNCRNYDPFCATAGPTGPVHMPLKDFSTTLDTRTGGDSLAGLNIVANSITGNKVTDGGVPCGVGYVASTSSCRWRVTATYRPDYNDAMRFFLTIAYEPPETDDPHKIPLRSWEMVVPVNDLCSTL